MKAAIASIRHRSGCGGSALVMAHTRPMTHPRQSSSGALSVALAVQVPGALSNSTGHFRQWRGSRGIGRRPGVALRKRVDGGADQFGQVPGSELLLELRALVDHRLVAHM